MPGKVSLRDPSRRCGVNRRYRDGLLADARMHPPIRYSRLPFSDKPFITKQLSFVLFRFAGFNSRPSMANTFSCLKIHCVFSTKQRAAVLSPDIVEHLDPPSVELRSRMESFLNASAASRIMSICSRIGNSPLHRPAARTPSNPNI